MRNNDKFNLSGTNDQTAKIISNCVSCNIYKLKTYYSYAKSTFISLSQHLGFNIDPSEPIYAREYDSPEPIYVQEHYPTKPIYVVTRLFSDNN